MSDLAHCLPRRSRARYYGEIACQLSNFHPLFDGQGVKLRFRGLANPERSYTFTPDRTHFVGGRRIRLGTYLVECTINLAGMFNDVHVGRVRVYPGLNQIDVDLSGAVVTGRIPGLDRSLTPPPKLELALVETPTEHSVVHSTLVTPGGRFVFTGLCDGVYLLSGEVVGYGDVAVESIQVVRSKVRDLGVVAITPAPYLRFDLRSTRGRRIRGPVSVFVSQDSQDGRTLTLRRSRGRDMVLLRPAFEGPCRYSIEARGFRATDGRIVLRGTSQTVQLVLERSDHGRSSKRRTVRAPEGQNGTKQD